MGRVSPRYEGHWRNVQDDCMLCEMDKRTEWHLETKKWVVAEKLGGGPFIVSKRHQKTISDEKWEQAERVVGLVFDTEFDLQVQMNLVKDHWHAHIVHKGTTQDLSKE